MTLPALVLNFSLISFFLYGEIFSEVGFYVVGLITFVFYLILIRLLDEIKDYEHDNEYYKERPVQSGLISIAEIKKISLSLIVLLTILNLFVGKQTFLLYIGSLIFLFLMFKEFFIGSTLKKNLILYSLTHQFYVPVIILYLYSLAGTTYFETEKIMFILLNVLLVSAGEVARKIRDTKSDNNSKDTYSSYLGHPGACFLLAGILSVFLYLAGSLFDFPWQWNLTLLLPLGSFVYYLLKNTKKSSELILLTSSSFLFLVILGIYLG